MLSPLVGLCIICIRPKSSRMFRNFSRSNTFCQFDFNSSLCQSHPGKLKSPPMNMCWFCFTLFNDIHHILFIFIFCSKLFSSFTLGL